MNTWPFPIFSHCKSFELIIHYSLTILDIFSILLDHLSGYYLIVFITSFVIKKYIERCSQSTADFFYSITKTTINGMKKKKEVARERKIERFKKQRLPWRTLLNIEKASFFSLSCFQIVLFSI